MADELVRITGSESEVNAFRQELLNELKARGYGAEDVEISQAKPAPRKLTEPAPLGHVEWVEIAIKIAVAVLSPVITTLVKELMERRSKTTSLKAHTHTAGRG